MTRSQLQAAGLDHGPVRCGRFDQRTRKHCLQVVRYAAIGCQSAGATVRLHPVEYAAVSGTGRGTTSVAIGDARDVGKMRIFFTLKFF